MIIFRHPSLNFKNYFALYSCIISIWNYFKFYCELWLIKYLFYSQGASCTRSDLLVKLFLFSVQPSKKGLFPFVLLHYNTQTVIFLLFLYLYPKLVTQMCITLLVWIICIYEFIRCKIFYLTCRPSRTLLVTAVSGKIAWTWGTSLLVSWPPSGPMRSLSCWMRDTTAKYSGKSVEIMRRILFFSSSSWLSRSDGIRSQKSIIIQIWKKKLLKAYELSKSYLHPCRWGWSPARHRRSDYDALSTPSRSHYAEPPVPDRPDSGMQSEESPQSQA